MRYITDNEINNSLEIVYEGDLTVEKLSQDIHYDLSLLSRKDFALVLVDLTKARMLFSPRDLGPVTETVQAYSEKYKSINVALIVDLPIPTANMQMLGSQLSKGHIQYRVFSEVKSGRTWLNI